MLDQQSNESEIPDMHNHELERIYQNIDRERLGLPPIGKPGRSKISHDDLIYRLAMAKLAEELKKSDPSKTWKIIRREIGWYSHPKLLEDARNRLKRAKKDEKLMREVDEYLKNLR
jgi:hypothetical protein